MAAQQAVGCKLVRVIIFLSHLRLSATDIREYELSRFFFGRGHFSLKSSADFES